MQIKGARVLITGSNRGIGLAIAESLASRGANLVLAMRKEDPSLKDALIKKGAASVKTVALDLGSRESIDAFCSVAGNLEVDILVNNAGQLTGGLIENQPIEDIYSMFQVNLVGLVHLTAKMIPGMVARKRGKIVNNSSVSGVMHFPCASTYSAAKTGVVAFTECIRQELVGAGVSTLLVITPGVKTRMFDEIPKQYGDNLELSFLEKSIPAEEWAEQIAEAITRDQDTLYPSGSTRFGLLIAQHAPGLFAGLLASKFKRG